MPLPAPVTIAVFPMAMSTDPLFGKRLASQMVKGDASADQRRAIKEGAEQKGRPLATALIRTGLGRRKADPTIDNHAPGPLTNA
jgi:hypothetical protein